MNYIYENDGWRGDSPTWDATAPVLSDVDYAEELRESLYMDMSMVLQSSQKHSKVDIEAQANMEHGLVLNE